MGDFNLQTYPAWDPAFLPTQPFRDISREQAENFFGHFIEVRNARIAHLAVAHSTTADALFGSEALLSLGQVIVRTLQAEGHAAFSDARAPLVSAWVADISLLVGERCIRVSQGRADLSPLSWHLSVSHKKATGYQRPVLMGFSQVHRDYYVDVAFFVSSWCELAARGRKVRDDFLLDIEASTLRDAATNIADK